mmetsp:Transcript_4324/g.7483  ORF Transcript_4324/g.7483 Transcript_4324/m.7483 type:complete len:99 (+) Transcript_4324:613-909(+)
MYMLYTPRHLMKQIEGVGNIDIFSIVVAVPIIFVASLSCLGIGKKITQRILTAQLHLDVESMPQGCSSRLLRCLRRWTTMCCRIVIMDSMLCYGGGVL